MHPVEPVLPVGLDVASHGGLEGDVFALPLDLQSNLVSRYFYSEDLSDLAAAVDSLAVNFQDFIADLQPGLGGSCAGEDLSQLGAFLTLGEGDAEDSSLLELARKNAHHAQGDHAPSGADCRQEAAYRGCLLHGQQDRFELSDEAAFKLEQGQVMFLADARDPGWT